MVGAAAVAFLVKNFAPEAKGHGVPEVMDAVYFKKGVIRPIVAVIKSLASAISIGSGGSVGREGPIIQIGSSFGSTLGQILRLTEWERITLIAAGTSGGIAATFNTPIGGVLFAVEIMMLEISAKTLVPVAISSATATYVGSLFFGYRPSFVIPAFTTAYFHATNPAALLAYAVLGALLGFVSILYIRSIYGFEDFFAKRVRGSYYWKHMLGMLPVGIVMYLMMKTTGHYYTEGVGYSTVQDILMGDLSLPLLLLLLFFLKLLTTSLTLGSGASGGIFSPSLFMGATLGAAYGILLGHLFPGLGISAPAFAVAGMAGLVGGATGAAMAAIVMIFEMTLDYNVIIPMIITVATSYGTRMMLMKESIYTMKLVRRGHRIPRSLRVDVPRLRHAADIMDDRISALPAATPLDEARRTLLEKPEIRWLVSDASGTVSGIASKETVQAELGPEIERPTLDRVASRRYVIVPGAMNLHDVIDVMHRQGAPYALVTKAGGGTSSQNVAGVITIDEAAESAIESGKLLSDSF